MGTIWTPGGEHESGGGPGGGEPTDEERRQAEAAMAEMREELRATPVADIVANHAIGLWQLAVLHLGVDGSGAEPNLAEARLAIDALSGMLEGAGQGLGSHADVLGDALTNVRLAYVQLSGGDAEPASDA